MDDQSSRSAEQIADDNAWTEGVIQHRRAALIEAGFDPDTDDGYGCCLPLESRRSEPAAPAATHIREESSVGEGGVEDSIFGDTEPHPCEGVLKKIEARLGAEATWHLRGGWVDIAFAGVEFGDAPASPAEQEMLKQEEIVEIHRLNHATKEAAKHMQRGGGRPSSRQQKRMENAFSNDVAEHQDVPKNGFELFCEIQQPDAEVLSHNREEDIF